MRVHMRSRIANGGVADPVSSSFMLGLYTLEESAVWNTLARSLWDLALSWLILMAHSVLLVQLGSSCRIVCLCKGDGRWREQGEITYSPVCNPLSGVARLHCCTVFGQAFCIHYPAETSYSSTERTRWVIYMLACLRRIAAHRSCNISHPGLQIRHRRINRLRA